MLKDVLVQTYNAWWDTLHRVETRSHAAAMTCDGSAYEPIGLWHLRAILKRLQWDWQVCTFVDLGSGKGRPVLYAARFPFQSVVGVEYNAALHQVAERNLRAYRGRRRARTVTVVHGDARTYQWPLTPLVILLFNPFHASVMRQVCDNLKRSIAQHPRPLAIACTGEYTIRTPFEDWADLRREVLGPAVTLYYFAHSVSPNDYPIHVTADRR